MTYAGTGVDYRSMDPFKIFCQKRAEQTANNALRLGAESIEATRGESVYMVKIGDDYFGHVEEGLGTKDVVADDTRKLMRTVARSMRNFTGKTYYDQIGQCTLAMIVNDMITLGIFPISAAMHLAVGDSTWFNDEQRSEDLANGWGNACNLARCIWGGGETPTLRGLVNRTPVLSGSAFGKAKNGRCIDPVNIQHGDAIIILESSGLHANGYTLARKIATNLDPFWRRIAHRLDPQRFPPHGYLEKLSDGRYFGEALLDPTHIYVGAVEDCMDAGVDIHYAVNVTGHGWRKLMRANQRFAYNIDRLPARLPIFDFIQKHGPVSDYEAYGNFNMGAGFVLYVREGNVDKALGVLNRESTYPFRSFRAGWIEKSDVKRVIIRPKRLEFSTETLAVR
jgi:phosphoribosylformylglycinamidine cyclo-ligase